MVKVFSEVLGTAVPVPDPPERIVSFSPAATETLFQLGLGEKVVGVTAFCARPAEAQSKRKLGSYNTVREEILDELNPDLILAVTGYQREFAVRLSKKYPVYPLELPLSVAGIIDFVVKVGLVTGAAGKGRELGAALLRSLGRLPRVSKLDSYVEINLGGPVSFGAYSYITDAFRLLGSSHLYEDEPREWLVPDLKAVSLRNPDAVFYEPKMYSKFEGGDLATLLRSRGWTGLKAVALGNVFVTPGPLDFLAHHGPSFITQALPWLAEQLAAASERV
ncbi:MAG: ABC transporter substrate-binding protein [Nitrososphaerota archaeon]|jgi:ABC-type Fe3+-hydroxamate transport system substrate-binding protein|nr:helical backbone metal receptor [Nitrososphaerota archaeon]MDG6903298.1 ABC transporter substrate-binding protein [Nitrososphaerota archaeon]MDG6911841.1 ABC transporter substrate-binding protein [Nitrososphaerota archaeon]MDG6940678.1 ABC transporter substrate-binding protein [Nitrososphaerota archaeon]MDG6960988.1 ABC transporter substrate-binding protein [Nitrososphaerota archaeon]